MSPGQRDRAAAELKVASTALREASALLDAGLVLGAISRLYYAAFHAARAALLARGRYAKTHNGQLTLFSATFGNEPLLGELLRQRIIVDYRSVEFDTAEVDGRAMLHRVDAFVERCRTLVAAEVAGGVRDPDPPPDL